MKKFMLFLLAATLVASNTFAQYKPGKGSVSTEVQFNPFDQDGETFKLDGLKIRYFFTNNDALRLKVGFNSSHFNTSSEYENTKGANGYRYSNEDEFESTTGNFTLNLGYERHFNVAKRLSVYVGVGVGFDRHFASMDFESSTELSDNLNDRKAIESSRKGSLTNGAITEAPDRIETENLIDYANDRAYWGINASIFTGIDFYVYKGLYVGTELGLGVNTLKYSEMKYNQKNKEDGVVTYKEYRTNDDTRLTSVKLYIEPVLRLGWTF